MCRNMTPDEKSSDLEHELSELKIKDENSIKVNKHSSDISLEARSRDEDSDSSVESYKRRASSDEDSSKRKFWAKRAKSVSFADCRGLDLAEVCEFEESHDCESLIEKSCASEIFSPLQTVFEEQETYFLLFPQPCINYNTLMKNLRNQNVCLESARVDYNTVSGAVKVVNLAFEKLVQVKLTYDSWRSFYYLPATFAYSESEWVDRFAFSFTIPPDTKNIKFCIKYSTLGREYWDNNRGFDYCIAAYSQTPTT